MQFKLSLATIAALVAAVVAHPAVSTILPCLANAADAPPQADVPVTVLTQDEMINWLKTTDATLTFIGNPIPGVNAPEGLVSREALDTTVTYCNKRVNSVCGGDCTVYTGGPTCLNAPDTTCLAATHDVGFCDRKG